MDMKMMEGRCSETQDTVQGEEGDKETEKPEAKESGGKETAQGISQESSRKKVDFIFHFFWRECIRIINVNNNDYYNYYFWFSKKYQKYQFFLY